MALKTRYGHLQYQVMSFGLTNIPTTFLCYINTILVGKLNVFIIVYLDNIFIYGENKKKRHLEAIQLILDQLWKYLLYTNLEKCWFH